MTKKLYIVAFVLDTDEAPWLDGTDPEKEINHLAAHLSDNFQGDGIDDIMVWTTPDEFVTDHAVHGITVEHLENAAETELK